MQSGSWGRDHGETCFCVADPLPHYCRMVLTGPTTNQAASRQQSSQAAGGGVVGDIKIENFDIAFGNQ